MEEAHEKLAGAGKEGVDIQSLRDRRGVIQQYRERLKKFRRTIQNSSSSMRVASQK